MFSDVSEEHIESKNKPSKQQVAAIGAVRSPESSANFYQTIRCHILEISYLFFVVIVMKI
jgi:hypothetical protein